jgi:hypothetical protein
MSWSKIVAFSKLEPLPAAETLQIRAGSVDRRSDGDVRRRGATPPPPKVVGFAIPPK